MRTLQQQYVMSDDAESKKLLAARYSLAAIQAAEMFGIIFSREIPEQMLTMPPPSQK